MVAEVADQPVNIWPAVRHLQITVQHWQLYVYNIPRCEPGKLAYSFRFKADDLAFAVKEFLRSCATSCTLTMTDQKVLRFSFLGSQLHTYSCDVKSLDCTTQDGNLSRQARLVEDRADWLPGDARE
jgi:hypothetical protein